MPRDESPLTPQLAQASGGGAAPIGRVDTVTGTVTAQRLDGSVVTLEQGAPVFAKDVLSTQAGAKVALVFADKTTFALGESGQMKLDEMVYNPSAKSGKLALTMLKGAFAFATGDIATTESDAMTVKTPVGTIGIRGTAVAGNVDANGGSTFAALPDPSGAPSIIAFTNGAGTRLVTENTQISVQSFFTAPSPPTAVNAGSLGEAGALSFIANALSTVVNPGGSTPAGGAEGGPTNPAAPAGGEGGSSGSFPTTTTFSFASGDAPAVNQAIQFYNSLKLLGGGEGLSFYQPIQPASTIPPSAQNITPPPPPPPPPPAFDPFKGTLGTDRLVGTPGPDTFNFTAVPNSLTPGDAIDGNGGLDVLNALFDHPVNLAGFSIVNVPVINLTFAGDSSIDFSGVTGGAVTKVLAKGTGALTVTHLQTNFDGSAMPVGMAISASAGGIKIVGSAGSDTITTAAAGSATTSSAFTDAISHAVSTSGAAGTIVAPGGGNNQLHGGLQDTVDYSNAPNSVVVDLGSGQVIDNGFGGTDSLGGIQGVTGSASGSTNTVYLGANQFAHVSNIQIVHGDSVTGGNVLVLDAATPSILIDHVDVVLGSTGNDSITVDFQASGTPPAAGAAGAIPAVSPPPPPGGSHAITAFGGGGNDTLTVVSAGNNDTMTGPSQVDGFSQVHFLNTDDPMGSTPNSVLLRGPVVGVDGSGLSASATSIDFGPSTHTGDTVTVIGSAATNYVTVNGAEAVYSTVGTGNYRVVVQGDVTAASSFILGGSSDVLVFDTDSAVTANVFGNGVITAFGSGFGDTVVVNGLAGVDYHGAAGNDSISTGSANAILSGGAGNNTLAGGGAPGVIVAYDDLGLGVGAVVDLAGGSASHDGFTDALSGFDGVLGSAYGDTITATGQTTYVNGGGGADVLYIDGSTIDVYNVESITALTASSVDVTVHSLGTSGPSSFDFTNATGGAVMEFALAGGGTFSFTGSPGPNALIALDDLYLSGGSYNITFTGNVLATTLGNQMYVDASAASGLSIDASAEGVGGLYVVAGAGAETVIGAGYGLDELDYSASAGGIGLTFNAFAALGGGYGAVSGTGAGGAAAGDVFTDVSAFFALKGGATNQLIIGASATAINGVDLGVGLVGIYGGDAVAVDGFNSVLVQSSTDMHLLTSGMGADTIVSGGGNDSIYSSGVGNSIAGGGGNDVIQSFGGDSVDGGSGDDFIQASAGAGETIVAGLGNDTLDVVGNGFSIDLGAGDDFVGGVGGLMASTIIGGGGSDTIALDGPTHDIVVSDIAEIFTASNATSVDIEVDHVSGPMIVDLTGSGATTLTFDLIGPSSLDFYDLNVGKGAGSGNIGIGDVDAVFFQGTGNFHVTFDGDFVFAPTVDASQLTGGGSLFFDNNTGADVFTVVEGAGHDTLYGNPTDTIDYTNSASPIAVQVASYNPGTGGASGTGTAGDATGDQFVDFGWVRASDTVGGDLTISVSTGQQLSIQLGDATIAGSLASSGGTAFHFSGFNSVHYTGTDNAFITGDPNFDFLNGGHETLSGGSGNDTIAAGGNAHSFFDGNGTGAATMSDFNALYLPDYGTVTVTITELDENRGGVVNGTIADACNMTTFASFHHFAEIEAEGGTSSTLVIDVGAHGNNVQYVDLSFGEIGFNGGACIDISYFENVSTIGSTSQSGIEIDGDGYDNTFMSGTGADTMYGDSGYNTLDYTASGGPVSIAIGDQYHDQVTGFGTGGANAAGDMFDGINEIMATPGSTLVIVGGSGDITDVDLNAGQITGCGTTYISGFKDIANTTADSLHLTGDNNANAITAGSGGDTLTGGGGGDVLTGGIAGGDEFRYLSALDSYSSSLTGADANTDLISNFNDASSLVDLSGVFPSGFYGGSDTAANRGSFAAGTDFSTVFTGESAGEVDFATIGGETFLHMAVVGGGYSTSDLLIHIQGAHTLTATNVQFIAP